MLAIGRNADGQDGSSWRPPIVKTVASRAEGVDELVAAIDTHREHLAAVGELESRRRARARAEIEALVVGDLRRMLTQGEASEKLDSLAGDVVFGVSDPFTAAASLRSLLGAMTHSSR
jgi:LAO/AO transport system kinase